MPSVLQRTTSSKARLSQQAREKKIEIRKPAVQARIAGGDVSGPDLKWRKKGE